MIWLASFPRSGNTFFRNVLYNVYGIESSTYHSDPNRELDTDYASYPVVKTHLLPHQLVPSDEKIPAVYLVRDGRDALVSLAHHRKDIVEPGTDFENNLLEAMCARGGSHFGGWSKNVSAWRERADIIIRYEDLIKDPIKEVEKLRQVIELPQPTVDRLPTFEDLKFGQPKYGGGGNQFVSAINQKNFRSGKAGSHRSEMPHHIENRFWEIHGQVMMDMGYGAAEPPISSSTRRVLIEGSKYFSEHMDGIGRYVQNLIKFLPVLLNDQNTWHVDLLHKNQVIPLIKAQSEKKANPEQLVLEHRYEIWLLLIKDGVKKVLPARIYAPLRDLFIAGPWRQILRRVRKWVNLRKIKQLQTELISSEMEYDLVHVPLPQHLENVHHLSKKLVTTVHDITHKTHPEFHDQQNVANAEAGMQSLIKHDSDIIAVSQDTLDQTLSVYPIVKSKAHMIYEGIDPDHFHRRWRNIQDKQKDRRYNLPSTPFILTLSTLEPRKNIIGSINAFLALKDRRPDLEATLLIAGKKGWKLDELMTEIAKDRPGIHFTGYIDDEDLPYVFAKARGFCFPSFAEGFGLPLLEAMACGTPVIYGDNSAMAEIINDNGIPTDPSDVGQISMAMETLLYNNDVWNELSDRSWKHANHYTWLKMAAQTIDAYEQILVK